MSTKIGGSSVTVAQGVTLNWMSQDWSATATNQIWTKNGDGTWIIGANGNAASATGGSFTLNAGTVEVSGNNSFGGSNSMLTINAGTIQSSGGRTFANSNVVIGGNFIWSGTGNDNYTGAVSLGAATRSITNLATGLRVLSGTISGSSGSGLTFAGTGTNVLAGSNTYDGTTTIAGGVLQISNIHALQNSTLAVHQGAVAFTLAGSNTYNLGGLSGSNHVNLGGNLLRVGGNNANTLYAGRLTNAGSLSKAGAGTLTLSGSNTYTGATLVEGGRLAVDGSVSSAVLVTNGGVLGGSGIIGNTVTLNGGTLSPGNSIETLAVTGDLTFNHGSVFEMELDSSVSLAAAADLVTVAGGLNLNGTVYLTLTNLASGSFATNTTFALINYDGAWNTNYFTFGSALLTNNATFTAGQNTWQISYDATVGGTNYSDQYFLGDSRYVVITAVPEPSTYALLALAAAGLGAHVMMRRRR